jgi:sirohydrochlorin cobaltochelatase
MCSANHVRVPHVNFQDATLVVLGHGTTKNEDSAAPVYQHAAEIRRRNLFNNVREAFWKQEPRIADVLGSLRNPRVFIVPLFISEGYFSEQVIPEALGYKLSADPRSRIRMVSGPDQTGEGESRALVYCRPIGTHESMTAVLLARAQETVAKFPFPRAPKPKETTLVVAGHGTERNENSRRNIDRQVELIRAAGGYGDVHAVFLDEEPRIPECYRLARTKYLVVVPFFISDGMHTQEDIPMLLGEPERFVRERLAKRQPTWRNPSERQGKLVWYAPAVGTEPHVADVILERVQEAAGWLGS